MSEPDQMNLLVFSANNRRFGLDAAQIAEIKEPQDVEKLDEVFSGGYYIFHGGEEIPVISLAERIGLEKPFVYRTPKIVVLKADGARTGFLIGDLEEVVSVSVEDIELLPELVERTGAGAGVWGIARWADHLVILIDLMEAAGTD